MKVDWMPACRLPLPVRAQHGSNLPNSAARALFFAEAKELQILQL